MSRAGRVFLSISLTLAVVLLVKFAFDLSRFNTYLSLALFALIAASLAACVLNILPDPQGSAAPAKPAPKAIRTLLLLAIPSAFVASSLDCMGLSVKGCTATCTFVKLILIPLIATACLIYLRTGRKNQLVAIAVIGLVALIPNCVCDNPANGWWIDRLGRSPQCYLWGYVCCLVSVSALLRERWLWYPLIVCYTIIGGAFGFFVAHHYSHMPW